MCRGGRGYSHEQEAAQALGSKGQAKSWQHSKGQQPPSPSNGARDGQQQRRGPAAKELNLMICKAAEHGGLQRLLDVAAQNAQSMTCVNLSTALHKLARLAKEGGGPISPHDSRFLALHERIMVELKSQAMGQAKALVRCLSTFAWSYATMQIQGLDVAPAFELMGKVASLHLGEFNPLELTNLLWGFAKTCHADAKLFQAARARVEADLTPFSSTNLSTLAWAYATAQQQEQGLLLLLAEGFSKRLLKDARGATAVKPVELVNMLWSLATAGVKPKERVIRLIGSEVVKGLSAFKVQEMSIAAWSLSRMQIRFDSFFDTAAWCLTASEVVWQMHPQGIANLLWAFERQKAMGMEIHTNPHVKRAMAALLEVCWQLLPQLSPQEFACAFTAIAKLRVQQVGVGASSQGRFLADAARQGIAMLPNFARRHCADLLRAFTDLVAVADGIVAPEVLLAFLDGLLLAAPQVVSNVQDMNRRGEVRAMLEGAIVQQGLDGVEPWSWPNPMPADTVKVNWADSYDDHAFAEHDGSYNDMIGQDFLFLDNVGDDSPKVFRKLPQARWRSQAFQSQEPIKVLSRYSQTLTAEPARPAGKEGQYSQRFLSEPAKICIQGSPSSSFSSHQSTKESTRAGNLWQMVLEAEFGSKQGLLPMPPGLDTPPGLPAPAELGRGSRSADLMKALGGFLLNDSTCLKEQIGA